jgi:hypothetical protein
VKRDWHPDELTEHWTLTPGEKQQALSKREPSWLGFSVLLKFSSIRADSRDLLARCPRQWSII